jgi:hypothetical protein
MRLPPIRADSYQKKTRRPKKDLGLREGACRRHNCPKGIMKNLYC